RPVHADDSPLALHDALPISGRARAEAAAHRRGPIEMTAASMPALRTTEPGPGPAAYAVEELWYMLLSRRWSSLAVVSPERTPNTDRKSTRLNSSHGSISYAV